MLDLGGVAGKAIESIELVRLPSPPHILTRLLELCRDPTSTRLEYAALIGIDPTLTGRLLMATPAGRPFVSLEQTIEQLGLELVRATVESAAVQQLYAGLLTSQKEFVCRVWLSSYYTALFSRELAHALDRELAADAYLAGLLHDFGQILFDARNHDTYLAIAAEATEAQMIAAEQSNFGITHSELGAAILDSCAGLDPAIADAVRFHHEGMTRLRSADPLCRIVAEANQLGHYWSHNGDSEPKWRSSLVSEAALGDACTRVREHMIEFASQFGFGSRGSKALTLDTLVDAVERDTLRMARLLRNATLTRLVNSETMLSPRAASPAELTARIARELQLYFSIFDVAVLVYEQNGGGRLALHTARQVRTPIRLGIEGSDSLLVRSFVERHGAWIAPDTSDVRPLAVPDRQVLRRLGSEIAWAQPMAHGDEALGVIVIGCDRDHRGSLDKLIDVVGGYAACLAGLWLRGANGSGGNGPRAEIDKLIHEISNPLAVIGNYIEVIRGNDGTTTAREIDILKDEVQRVRNIVLNFRKHEAVADAVQLNAELQACVPLYVASADDGHQVEVSWDLDSVDSEIAIGRDAFRQVALNLVKNAVEAQPDGVKIHISSRHFANIDGRLYAQFSVADRGRGVAADTRGQLFSPLASHKQGSGRGVGLAVVADILRGCGGQIKYVANEHGGATFEILIPLSSKH